MKQIICKNGEVALCDDEDYALLSRFIWYMGSEVTKGRPYPCCFIYGKQNTRKQIFMHQMVMSGAYGIDHRDNNSMNNQKSNLRAATYSQNGGNMRKARSRKGKPLTSKHKGVTFTQGKYRATIRCQGKTYCLGSHIHEDDAGRAYNSKAKELFGEYAHLNQF